MNEMKSVVANLALEALEMLTGQWDMEIRWSPETHALAGGPATIRGVARFNWIEDGHYLVQLQGDDEGLPKARWLIGRDDASGEYTILYADSRGISRVYQMTFANGIWRVWRSVPGFSQRFEGRLGGDGLTIDGRWEKSADGETWKHDFDLKYSKRKRVGS